MTFETHRRVTGWKVRVGGDQHSGWLPAGASSPQPTPEREEEFDIEIQFDGAGFVLIAEARDRSLYSDTWHETLEEALAAAEEDFGVSADDWSTSS